MASDKSFGIHLTKCEARVVINDLCSSEFFFRDCSFAAFEPVSTTKTKREDPGNRRNYANAANHNGCVVEGFLRNVSLHITLQEKVVNIQLSLDTAVATQAPRLGNKSRYLRSQPKTD